MSFREKSAWISFLTLLFVTVVFFGAQVAGLVRGHGGAQLLLLIGCVVGLIVLQIALHVAAAVISPADARSPKDERERAIQLRSHSVGYYVLVAGVVAMLVTGHVTFNVIHLMFHALAALTLSTLSIALTQIVLFRLSR